MTIRNRTHFETSFAGVAGVSDIRNRNLRSREDDIFLVQGRGINIDLDDVREGHQSIVLARLDIDSRFRRDFGSRRDCDFGSRGDLESRTLVKIDFSTIIEVQDENDVELTIVLKRRRRRDSVVLEQFKLNFNDVEVLPFSFTFIDDEVRRHRRHVLYTVEIKRINVENGSRVDEIETRNTAINAVVQEKDCFCF